MNASCPTTNGACAATEVPNSDHSAAGSVSGNASDVVAVTCDPGYAGGGAYTCSAGVFTGDPCTTPSGITGACADGTDEQVWPTLGVGVCAGTFTGRIDTPAAHALCNINQGWHVCTGTEMFASGLSYSDGRSFPGCYVYDAANDCHGCFETCMGTHSINGNIGCVDSLGGKDIAGIGHACSDVGPGTGSSQACVHGGRIDGASHGTGYCELGRANGVVCCAAPNLSNQPCSPGHYLDTTTDPLRPSCDACIAGQADLDMDTSTQCDTCPTGFDSQEGATTCTASCQLTTACPTCTSTSPNQLTHALHFPGSETSQYLLKSGYSFPAAPFTVEGWINIPTSSQSHSNKFFFSVRLHMCSLDRLHNCDCTDTAVVVAVP
jgi:hypothetical protein